MVLFRLYYRAESYIVRVPPKLKLQYYLSPIFRIALQSGTSNQYLAKGQILFILESRCGYGAVDNFHNHRRFLSSLENISKQQVKTATALHLSFSLFRVLCVTIVFNRVYKPAAISSNTALKAVSYYYQKSQAWHPLRAEWDQISNQVIFQQHIVCITKPELTGNHRSSYYKVVFRAQKRSNIVFEACKSSVWINST